MFTLFEFMFPIIFVIREPDTCHLSARDYGGGGYETDQSEDSIRIVTGMRFCRDEADLF